VCDQETSKNEEAKTRYGAVENTTKRVVTPGKQTTITLCFVQSFAGRLGMRCVSRHTLTLTEHICERKKAMWFALRNVTLSNTETIQPCFLVACITMKKERTQQKAE
jgi:hypothetical protein